MKPLNLAVKTLIDDRDKTDGNASFGAVLITPNGEHSVTKNLGAACFAGMSLIGHASYYNQSKKTGEPEVVFSWSKPPDREHTPVFERFNSWLVGAKSPYRSLWSKISEPLVVNGTDVTTDEFCSKYGYVFTDTSVPANLLVNFMIMSRSADEWRDKTEVWDWLVHDHGIDPGVAMYWAQVISPGSRDHKLPPGVRAKYDDHTWSMLGTTDGHQALDVWSRQGLQYFENFCHGRVAYPNHSYLVKRDFSPCNAVFCKWDEHEAYSDFIQKQYEGLLTEGEVKSSFRSTKVQQCKTPALLEMLRSEQKRIGL